MTERRSEIVRRGGITVETYIDGDGPPFVILPSYGRDGGEDYDNLTARLVEAGWKVLRPQPRGVAGTSGLMENLSMHDLAEDVALCIRALCQEPVVLLGHAFGNVLARVVTTDDPDLVRAVILAAAEASKVPEDVGKLPFVAGNLSASREERIAALRQGFFAPHHDPSAWLSGWYPATLRMQHAAAKMTGLSKSWSCGDVPLLQIIGEHDPFIPEPYWHELRDQLGDRVAAVIVKDASHALFPEQPEAVAAAVLPWAAQHKQHTRTEGEHDERY